jgi:hypothetical protein
MFAGCYPCLLGEFCGLAGSPRSPRESYDGTLGGTFGGPCVIAKKYLLMVSLPARLSVRAPTAAALSVSSRMLPETRAATSTSRLSAGPAATTTRTSQ